jgi:hypothetical protein
MVRPRFAPRLAPQLLDEIDRLARRGHSAADICRSVGDLAHERSLPRPSYERVRRLVNEARARAEEPTLLDVTTDVMFRVRPPGAILDHVSGVGVPKLRP